MSVIADPTKRKRPQTHAQRDPQDHSQQHGEADAKGRGSYGNYSGVAIWGPGGWLTAATDYIAAGQDSPGQDPLVCHGAWLGPEKLVNEGGKLKRLAEVFVSHELFGDQSVDFESSEQRDSLFATLNATVLAGRLPGEHRSWRAPERDQLLKWLSAGGFQAAVDDQGNLRLTLKARGCDGQVRVCRADQRLRLTMRLGSWSDLNRESETAMLHLARQANDRGRLARIAWIVDGNSRRCEAQVDLTGLPVDGPAERIWPSMLCMSIRGLELALRRLGMELDALADPSNRAVTAQLIRSANLESDGTVPAGD